MQPIKITAVMQDGRVAGNEPWFPLDSILAAFWIRKHRPDLAYTPITEGNFVEAELPFARRGKGDTWYWACSFNTERPQHEYVTHWHKRVDDSMERYLDFGKRRGKINATSGKYKSYRMPLVIQVFDRLVWYAVGDLDAVRELCEMVTHIGKKPSQGYGAVNYWAVEPWPEDHSVIKDSRLVKAVPMDDGMSEGITKANIRLYGIRPPYWMQDNQVACFMPGVGEL